MTEITNFNALMLASDATFKGNLLRLLAAHGVPTQALMAMCLETAETIRSTKVSHQLEAAPDMLARQYEDIASILAGNGMMPR